MELMKKSAQSQDFTCPPDWNLHTLVYLLSSAACCSCSNIEMLDTGLPFMETCNYCNCCFSKVGSTEDNHFSVISATRCCKPVGKVLPHVTDFTDFDLNVSLVIPICFQLNWKGQVLLNVPDKIKSVFLTVDCSSPRHLKWAIKQLMQCS